MKSYCLKYRKILKTEIQKFQKQVMVEQCYYQEAKGLLSNLRVRTPLSKVPILGDILL